MLIRTYFQLSKSESNIQCPFNGHALYCIAPERITTLYPSIDRMIYVTVTVSTNYLLTQKDNKNEISTLFCDIYF